jgi:D-3-phosphoglycerate dehydrogenase
VKRIVCIGDRFISGDLLAQRVRDALGKPCDEAAAVTTLSSDWPDTPFRNGAGIREWAGDIDEVLARAADASVIVTHLGPVNEAVLAAAGDSLELVAVTRGGPVNVDLDAATRRHVPVAYLPGRNLEAVAEFVIGVMITGPRNIAASSQRMHGGELWTGELFAFDRCGSELQGAVVGLIGLGEIGVRVAELLRVFGATVLAHDPYAAPARAAGVGVELVSLPNLFERATVISLHARLTEETRGLIGADELRRLRPGTYLVNTARGELLDEEALADALDAGHLSGAALDVFRPEPLAAGSRLRNRTNVILSSHLAGSSRQVATGAATRISAVVAEFLATGRLEHCANPEVFAGRPS